MGRNRLLAVGAVAKEIAVFAMNGRHSPDLELHIIKRGQYKKSIILYRYKYYPLFEAIFDRGKWELYGKVSVSHCAAWMGMEPIRVEKTT